MDFRALFSFILTFSAITSCLGQANLGHLTYNFTLAAVNVSRPNANATGAPLVLGQNGASSGISFYVTSTYHTFPYNDYPSLALIDNTLRAYTSSGEWITNATEVRSGGFLGWVTTTIYLKPAPNVYSAIMSPAHEFPQLAAHGIRDLWSLCPSPGLLGQTNVVFNVSADTPAPHSLGFKPEDCYEVLINILPMNS
ncbi:hypothetical protein B0H34DRAFT_799253 [Crassisporium funariophilum]|nr:hypothetical protein B0H34DRAFT_799253 [Crassisporium funariophilum]